MGFRRRTRRRALIAGAAIAHHEGKKNAQAQAPADDQVQDDQVQAPQASSSPEPAQYAPPPADPADEIEHLAQLHSSGALTDEEFATAKTKILAS